MSAETRLQRLARTANALIPLYYERSEARWVFEQVGAFTDDAKLGAALRAALATVPRGCVSLDQWYGDVRVVMLTVEGDGVDNEEARALTDAADIAVRSAGRETA